jgi:hypothetical protein
MEDLLPVWHHQFVALAVFSRRSSRKATRKRAGKNVMLVE